MTQPKHGGHCYTLDIADCDVFLRYKSDRWWHWTSSSWCWARRLHTTTVGHQDQAKQLAGATQQHLRGNGQTEFCIGSCGRSGPDSKGEDCGEWLFNCLGKQGCLNPCTVMYSHNVIQLCYNHIAPVYCYKTLCTLFHCNTVLYTLSHRSVYYTTPWSLSQLTINVAFYGNVHRTLWQWPWSCVIYRQTHVRVYTVLYTLVWVHNTKWLVHYTNALQILSHYIMYIIDLYIVTKLFYCSYLME